MQKPEQTPKLPMPIRILVGLAGLPSLLLAYMLVLTFMREGIDGISAFEVVYSVIGAVALYIAISGKRLF
jgi:cytochrome c oxidase assembly factor CtaG